MREARIVLLRRIAISGLVLLSFGLARLQLVHGATYLQLADRNRLRVIPETAPRGLILDRHGDVVASNTFSFQLAVVPQELPKDAEGGSAAVFERLGRLVGKPAGELARTFAQQRGAPFLPATVMSRLPKAVALQVEEERWKLPAVVVNTLTSRTTPFGISTAHLIGYVGQPTAELFPTLKPYGVRPTDMVGRAGLEGALDASLRGRSGGSLIEVNHRARQVRVVGYREPVPGQAVTLTIDAKLQALITQVFGEQAGAAVVLDPRTGAVLAMVSSPSFDPELFATQQNAGIQALLDATHSPLLNRATLGAYPPGSTAKLITALTGLADGVITPQTTINCPGFLTIGDRKFHCWNRDGHGPMTLHDALRESCNVYFMQVGRRLGLARLRAGFAAVGFSKRTGWMLEETEGHLPSGRRFSEGEVALLAIGQGEILVTPLQAARMASAFANGGSLVTPWVVQQIGQDTTGAAHNMALGWLPAHVEAVRRGMIEVVNDPHGTGMYARSDRVVIAGKTGTAQTHVPGQTHAWFVGFCPANDPVAAMAILAEFGGSGGGLPAAIAKQICEYLNA